MSESEKKENCIIGSNNIESENLEQHNIMANSTDSLNESQNFQLVDFDDDAVSDKEEKSQDGTCYASSGIRYSTTNASDVATAECKPSNTDKDKTFEKENTENVHVLEITKEEKAKSDSNVLRGKENLVDKEKTAEEDEEEDIIECTPPDTYSPSKKQIEISAEGITSLKRKAESFDEPPKKILRTSSNDDVSVHQEKEMREEKESQFIKTDDTQPDFSDNGIDTSLIIAETQDITEDEVLESTMEKLVNDKKPTKDVTKTHIESQVKDVDKNENFNDILVSEEVRINKEVEQIEIVEEAEKVYDEKNEMVVTDIKKDDTLSSKAAVIESVTLDENARTITDLETAKDSSSCTEHTKKIQDENTDEKENRIESTSHASLKEKSSEGEKILDFNKTTSEPCTNVNSNNAAKPRMSVEVIYDRSAVQEIKTKHKELVEIDEDGEKIILDSSQEDSDVKIDSKHVSDDSKAETVYKSCYDSKSSNEFSYKSTGTGKESLLDSMKSNNKLVNGSSESKRCDTDSTSSLQSDTFNDIPITLEKVDNISTSVQNISRQNKPIACLKDSDNADLLLSVSDNETDVYLVDDKSKSNLTHSSSIAKALQVEREISIYVRMKCLLQVDEGTKEFLSKEITGVQCEAIAEPTLIRQKNSDTSASLADISGNDNKDVSPGSINSNPQMYPLNPSRLSFASTISSLSSVSSAASLAAKLAVRDSTNFSLPKAPAKHAKKHIPDMHLINDKQAMDEAYERLSNEWQNSRFLTTSVLNFVNAELAGIDSYNVSNERIDDQLQKIRSSTPEVKHNIIEPQTPKSSKKGKAVKRPRSKNMGNQSNGFNKVSSKIFNNPTVNNIENNVENNTENTPGKKKLKTEHAEHTTLGTVDTSLKPALPTIVDDLIGKEVFAKWSDNNYYPGTVIDKVKTKYKVNFYDGKNKVLIEDFIITIPKVLREGLSVYATTSVDDYGSCGIIVNVHTVNNEVCYTVETDEGEKLKVQVKDIFLSSDQAQVLKEEQSSETKSLPITPKHSGQVSLDNMVDGKRRSRRIGTPVFSTPKSKITQITSSAKHLIAEPSVSGVTSTKDKKPSFESDGVSSDSNFSIKDETTYMGVQPEIIGTPHEQIVKGPQSRIKSKPRSKKKIDDEQTITTFGPIPSKDSNLFKGMSFILTCAPLETLDRYQSDIKDCSSDPGTENEEEWSKKPFVRDRLIAQISAGGGKIYTDFNDIPEDEYLSTKLITNVPNTTAKTLLCLSVGIPAYNHNWIIRCCQEGKIVNPAEDELPAGWSLDKKSYVEMFQRSSNKPLTNVVVIIPNIESEKLFITFWRKICENAGAVVLLADKPDTMEGFAEGTVVLTNRSCPSWAVGKASELQIPLLSTTWVVQSLIEGKFCRYDTQHRYKYNYIQN
ncbi:uncharacterized protein LOC144474828 [Augochlora pura]